jgi:hypothetical protein
MRAQWDEGEKKTFRTRLKNSKKDVYFGPNSFAMIGMISFT